MGQSDSTRVASFRSPPVVEVVAAVALDGMAGPEVAPLLGAYWRERLRSRFPRLEQQPPYSPTIEEFPRAGPFGQMQWNVGVPQTRLWAMTHDGTELLQLQPGWFACNWRKVQPRDQYDRWPARRDSFATWFGDLAEYMSREGLPELHIRQCEVTYINHVRPGQAWSDHGQLAHVLNLSLGAPAEYPLEQVSAEFQFVLKRDEEPYGRLHVRVLPAYDQDRKTPLYVLELTARGAPLGQGLPGALSFMDAGRLAINTTFASMTTSTMHEEWGREV